MVQESELPHQETEGLLSPLIRNIRLRQVAAQIRGGTAVLDLGCGEGYLRQFLPADCRYYGVDRVAPSSCERFSDFLVLDLAAEGSWERVRGWLPARPDYITCVAFLEHLARPGDFVSGCSRLLSRNGRFIGTTPHPRGRSVHEFLARAGICSRQGAEEHEKFLGRGDMERIAVDSGGVMSCYHQFLLGMNQIFVIEYLQNNQSGV